MIKLIGLLMVVGIVVVGARAVKLEEANLMADVASDSITEYNMAKRHGDKVDVCVRAGLVAEAYLQGKDEANYAKWRDIERTDCRRAGM